MMIGSKIAFWRHLGSHLGAPKRGRCSPSCENMAILGPLGRPRKRCVVDFAGIRGSQTGPKEQFSPSVVAKCKIAKSVFSSCVFHDFGGSGALELDQNGTKIDQKLIRHSCLDDDRI